jgi:hypothetical protein
MRRVLLHQLLLKQEKYLNSDAVRERYERAALDKEIEQFALDLQRQD